MSCLASRDRIRIEGFAGEIVKQAVECLRVVFRPRVDLYEVDTWCCHLPGRLTPLSVELCFVRCHRDRSKPLRGFPGSTLTYRDDTLDVAEIERRRVTELRRDENVLRADLLALLPGVVLDEDGDHLDRDHRYAVELVAAQERRADIHYDQNLDAHRARNVDRKVLADAAGHQEAPVALHWREHAGRGHAGSHRTRELARVDRDGLSSLEISRACPERGGKIVKIGNACDRQGQASQHLVEPLSLNQALG